MRCRSIACRAYIDEEPDGAEGQLWYFGTQRASQCVPDRDELREQTAPPQSRAVGNDDLDENLKCGIADIVDDSAARPESRPRSIRVARSCPSQTTDVPSGIRRDVLARRDDDVAEDVEGDGQGESLGASKHVGKFGGERLGHGEHDRLCRRDRSEQTVLRERRRRVGLILICCCAVERLRAMPRK